MPPRISKSPCERPIPKPEKQVKADKNSLFNEDENAFVEEEIEVYKDKIAIADEIHRIHKKAEEETRLGADEQMKQLQIELLQLRKNLREALILERTIIEKALRSYRSIQLSVGRRNANDTLGWLEDRWFDQRKKLDALLDIIYTSRKELADSESLVMAMEKCPRPGSLAWEKVCMARIVSLELMTQSMLVKKETVEILLTRYIEIKEILTRESGNYDKMLTDAENEMLYQRSELNRMQNALDFSSEQVALEQLDLTIVQKERKNGHAERTKIMESRKEFMMKKKPQKKLSKQSRRLKTKLPYDQSSNFMKHDAFQLEDIKKRVAAKQKVLEHYNIITECLTNVTHVRTIDEVPMRFNFLLQMRKRLKDEDLMKSELLNVMMRQKEQLLMIREHFQSTGDDKRKLGEKKVAEIRRKVAKVRADLKRKEMKLKQGFDRENEAKLGAVALLKRIRDCHLNVSSRSSYTRGKASTKASNSRMPYLSIEELGRLCGEEGENVIEFLDIENQRFNSPDDPELQAILDEEDNEPVMEERLLRVSSPAEPSGHNLMDFEFAENNVPSRLDIKIRNRKFIDDAIYKRDMGMC